jgi:hypothetical protein
MTWREAMPLVQGKHGILALRVSAQGKLVDQAGALASFLLSTAGALSGWPSVQGIVMFRITGKFLRWSISGLVVNADATPTRGADGLYAAVKWFGAKSDWSLFSAGIADALKG